MTIWDDIATERLGIAEVLEGLTEAQWQTPSLCGKWSVRELAGHLVVPFHTSIPNLPLAPDSRGPSCLLSSSSPPISTGTSARALR